MNNIEFLNRINAQLVYHIPTKEYLIHIGPVFGYNNINMGSFFLYITEKLVNEPQKKIDELFNVFTKENWWEELANLENIKYMEDFIFSENLYKLYKEKTGIDADLKYLPDYIIYKDGKINIENFAEYKDLSDTKIKDMMNLPYFYDINLHNVFTFPLEDLNNFYSTFCKIILHYKQFKEIDFSVQKNNIYNKTLEYFANFKSDCASAGINLILGSIYGGIPPKTYQTCGCNSSIIDNNMDSKPCSTLYAEAMEKYLKQMLGDFEFYYDWFFNTEGAISEPDNQMIDLLIQLIEEFKQLKYNLDFKGKVMSQCNCKELTSNQNTCNYITLDNYIQVLNWVKENKIDENKNKIKLYGEAFGELLPNLQF